MSTSKDETESPPKRFIFNEEDMAHFKESSAKKELLKIVGAMGKACSTCETFDYDPASPLKGLSPAMAVLHGALEIFREWVDDFPPRDQSMARFGNPSFRKWHERLKERSANVIACILEYSKIYPGPQQYEDAVLEQAREAGQNAAKATGTPVQSDEKVVIVELQAYLEISFGHPVRLDYGTGHECSFQVFLYCLCKLGCFGSTSDAPPELDRLKAVTLSIWHAYLKVTRRLQTDYMLEPAGSHGVWGLDDYHCLPFYFGACQLQASLEFEPSSIHNDSLLESHGDRLLYFGCIRFIKSLKKGVPFFEHSPMLNDISNIPTWSKISKGLLRMFEGEVLDKRQVVQHFVFKNVFVADWSPSGSEREAPTETFAAGGGGPMARAPWSDGGMPPPTKAPWAK